LRSLALLFSVWALGLFCATDAAQAQTAKTRPNIVLIVADDLGRDLGCYGDAVAKTPALDQLAKDGTRFDYAFCTTASCSASRSVILTGLYNHANGQYGHAHSEHHFRTLETLRPFPVLLAEAGYRTVRIGKFHVAPEDIYGFTQALGENAKNPVEMAERCRPVITAADERPFFLYFCTIDPHRGGGVVESSPHRPNRFGNLPQGHPGVTTTTFDPAKIVVPEFLPDSPACREELAQYYQSVNRMDQGVGKLIEILKEAGKYDNTLLIFVSDNGIPFQGAKTTLYEPGMRLPCIVRAPGQTERGIVSRAMINWVDLAPTILDQAGALPKNDVSKKDLSKNEAPKNETPKKAGAKNAGLLHGRSFLSIVGQRDPAGWDEIFASHTFHEVTMYFPMRVVRGRRYKLIWNLASPMTRPSASDLWASSTWQTAFLAGPETPYGRRTVASYLHPPRFELYDLEQDPHETQNLATRPEMSQTLNELQQRLRDFQQRTNDPWIIKWQYE